MGNRNSGRRKEPRIVTLATHPRRAVCLRVAAEYLDINERTLRARIELGRLRVVRDGKSYRIPLESIAAYERARSEEAT